MTSNPKRLKIVYIAGYGRSGSSILSRTLGTHPDVFSAGELGRLKAHLRRDSYCSCGERLSQCEIWSAIDQTASFSELEKLIAARGYRVIVDSSKTTYLDCLRPLFYFLRGNDVTIVHLKRPIAGVLQSVRKGTNRNLERGETKIRLLNEARAFLGYVFANFWAMIYAKCFSKSMFVYAPSLWDSKEEIAVSILQLSDIDSGFRLNPDHRVLENRKFHEIAGNRVLRSKSQKVE